MGLGPGDAEGDRAGLAEDDPGDFLKLAPNLIDQRLAGGGVRLTALAAFDQQGVDPSDIEIWFGDEARIGQKNKVTRRWVKRGSRPSSPSDQRTASTLYGV